MSQVSTSIATPAALRFARNSMHGLPSGLPADCRRRSIKDFQVGDWPVSPFHSSLFLFGLHHNLDAHDTRQAGQYVAIEVVLDVLGDKFGFDRERERVVGPGHELGLAKPGVEPVGAYPLAQQRAEHVNALARPAGGRDIKGCQEIMYEWRFAFLE